MGMSVNWQLVYNTTAGFIDQINLLSQFQTGQFTTCQSVYVDNQTVPEMVTLVCNETGFTVRVPPFAKGIYPLLCSTAPTFTLTLNLCADPDYGYAYSACTTRLFFFNTQQGYFEDLPNFGGQNYNSYYNNFIFGGASGAAQAYVMTSIASPGNGGLVSLGSNQIYAINSLDIAGYLPAGAGSYSAVTHVAYGISESGHSGPYIRYQTQAYATVNQTGLLMPPRQVSFPTPILQLDPLNSLYFFCNQTPQGVLGSLVMSCGMTYSVLTIQ